MEDWAEVHRLFHREGLAKAAIAKRLGMSRNTVGTLRQPGSGMQALMGPSGEVRERSSGWRRLQAGRRRFAHNAPRMRSRALHELKRGFIP